MSEYQVIARRYRPQKFSEVVGQEPIVQTLKNSIRQKKTAQAYLFCGSHGTGKTTLARLFAKALNCPNLDEKLEPCCRCPSCREIAHGGSLDVLEIDGASHRGIDDVRQINETVGYSSSTGSYKIYIIDEVHMLTKEAFNALLKTLEEPPAKVKFFFATTEPHKVLSTILSRCQRFNLARIPTDKIMEKLKQIAGDLEVKAEEEALRLIAGRSDGGLRDAESLLDQILSFHEGEITVKAAADILGIMERDSLFELDRAGKEGRYTYAFEVAHRLFAEGKDLLHFVETLLEHFRNLLIVKVAGEGSSLLALSESEIKRYEESAGLYSKEQCLTILDYLVEMGPRVRQMPSPQIALETILLHIMRTHKQLPIELLVRRLAELEEAVSKPTAPQAAPNPVKETVAEDPSPKPEELPEKPAPKPQPKKPAPPKRVEISSAEMKDQSRYDTLMQFAAVELEGKLQKVNVKRK